MLVFTAKCYKNSILIGKMIFKTFICGSSFKGHQSSTYKIDCCLSHDDKYVISGSEDGSLFIWDLIESTITRKIEKGHASVAYSLSVHPHELCFLSAGSYSVKLWQRDKDIAE